MHQIKYKVLHSETFLKQKNCDIFFTCKISDENWKKIGAHKFLLMSVSDVFDAMFYGKSVVNGGVKQEDVIEISDISYETFELFLRYIYGGVVTFDRADIASEFYYTCDKYNCKDGLIFAEKYMTGKVSPENVITFYTAAVFYELPDVKSACWNVFLKQTKDVLRSSEFLSATPDIIELIFKQEYIAIDSEKDLVVALERYIDHNKERDPEIAKKVRPALNYIRFLTLTPKDISDISFLNPDEMINVIKCLPPAKEHSKMPESFSVISEKRSGTRIQLNEDDIVLIKRLNETYSMYFCKACQNEYRPTEHPVWKCHFLITEVTKQIESIFSKYNHTFLMEYAADDIKTIYDFYKQFNLLT